MIPGRFGVIAGVTLRPFPLVRVGVSLPGITAGFQYLQFILDAGAMVTSVSAATAMTPIGVPLRWFATPMGIVASERLQGVGGSISTFTVNAIYRFRHTDGHDQDVTGLLRIGDLASPPIPPLLGWDVLEHFDIVVRKTADEVSLHPPRTAR